MPCSSGNSPTIEVSRSHLASSRRALARAAHRAPMRLGDRAGERAHALGLVVQRAELGLEGHGFSARAPRMRAARLRSCRRRTRRRRGAGAPRARCRRAPCAGSRLSMLVTVMKCGSSLPLRVAHREVPLVVLHRRDRHSCGSSRKRSSKRPASAHGHSTSAVTSSSSASSITASPPIGSRGRVAPAADALAALARSRRCTWPSSRSGSRSSPGSRSRARCGAMKAMAARHAAGVDAEDLASTTSCRTASRASAPGARTPRRRAPAHALGDRQRVERSAARCPAAASRSARPASTPRSTSHSPFGVSTRCSCVDARRRTSRRSRARPAVGWPSASNAAVTGGPLPLDVPGPAAARPARRTRTARRRGVANHSTLAVRRAPPPPRPRRDAVGERVAPASSSAFGGSSSVPSSTRKSRCAHALTLRRGALAASGSRAPRGSRSTLRATPRASVRTRRM